MTTGPAGTPAHAERGSRAALSGVVFVVLFVVGYVLLERSPGLGAGDDELREYLADPDRLRDSKVAGLYVIPLAGIAFMWFAVALRDRVVRAAGHEHPLLSGVQLIAATVFVTSMFAVGAAELAVVWAAEAGTEGPPDPDAVRGVLAFGATMAQVFTIRAAAVFVAVSTSRAHRAGLFPLWFTVVGFATAAGLLLASTTWRPVVLTIPAWVLATTWVVTTERGNRPSPVSA